MSATFVPSQPTPAFQRVLRGLIVGAMVALVGLVDYATGYEVSVFLLYAIPVAWATRQMSVAAGVAVALGSALVWMAVDRWSGHQYSGEWIWYVNALNRAVCFVFVALAIGHIRGKRAVLQARLSAFSGLRPVCSVCQRIGAQDGYWWSVADYLREHGGAQPVHKACPNCARHAYAKGGYRESAQQGM